MEQPESVHHRTGRAASQRVVSPRARLQRAPSLSPSHSTFSYGAPSPPLGSDIEIEYPAARPRGFQPKSLAAAADIDRAYPVAASVNVPADVGHMPLPYTDVDVCWPGSAIGPRQPESATPVGVRVHPVAEAQSTSVDVAPTFASAPTSAFTYVRLGTPIPSSVVDIAGQPSVGTAMHVGMLRGPALPTVVDVPRPLGLMPSSVDDVVRTSAVSVDVARPAYGLALPYVAEVARPPGPSSVDVVGPAYESTLSIAYEGVHLYTPPPVDVPRPSSVDVRRPMPYVGMRQPRSMRNADADKPMVGLTRSVRVGDRGRQGVGRSTSVDIVRQPHSSLMNVGITRPMPTPRQSSAVDVVYPPLGTDVVHPSSLGVDVVHVVHPPSMGVSAVRPPSAISDRFMHIGGTHPPSMGASVVGPTSAQVLRQSDVAYTPGPQPVVGFDDTSGTARPTSAVVGYQPGATATAYQPPTWTESKPAHASQYAAVRTDVAVHTSAETLTAQSLLLLGRHAASPQSSPHTRHLGQLHPRLVRLSQYRLVALSYNRHSLPVPKQPW